MRVARLYLLLILLFTGFRVFGENSSEWVRQSVLVLKPVNSMNHQETDYLSGILYNAVLSSLQDTDQFMIENFQQSKTILENKYFNTDIRKIGELYNGDAVIGGSYIVSNNTVRIQFSIFDVKNQTLQAVTDRSGQLGSDLLRIVDESVADLVRKVQELYPKMIKSRQDQNILEKKRFAFIKSPKNVAGWTFSITGSVLLSGGAAGLIYGLTGYASYYRSVKAEYERTLLDFNGYQNAYAGFIAIFVTSLSLGVTGAVLLTLGILFIVQEWNRYKKNEKKAEIPVIRVYPLCIGIRI